MTPGPDFSASLPPYIAASADRLIGLRDVLALVAQPASRPHGVLNLHAVLNLLNRLNSSRDTTEREELITRLADYLTALHRIEAGGTVTLSCLCELTRSYAAMRYLMADAIEPRVDFGERDWSLRIAEAGAMALFLQRAVDSLLDFYIPRLDMSVERHAFWQLQLTLGIAGMPAGTTEAPTGWSAQPGTACLTRSARFAGFRKALPRA
jgi:hypothetical protein